MGSSLDDIVALFPDGEHVFSTAAGEGSYAVRDDQEFFGVVRSRHAVIYHLGEENQLIAVSVSVPFEMKEQLLGTLISNFGPYGGKRDWGRRQDRYVWHEDRGIILSLLMTKEPTHGIAWMSLRMRESRFDR